MRTWTSFWQQIFARPKRLPAPRPAQIVLSQHESGVTLDFPLPHDFRPHARRRAWRIFEIGVLLAVGAIIWFSLCSMMNWPDLSYLTFVLFGAGLIALVLAAIESSAAWSDMAHDDDLRQISVADNLLIRTARDHRKQIWFCNEIRGFTADPSQGHLALELQNGERPILIGLGPGSADLEWVARVLRDSLASHGKPKGANSITDITELP